MNYIDLITAIDNNKLKNINLLFVKENYLLDLSIASLKKDFIGEEFIDFNFEKLEFKDLSFENFESVVETLPFMTQNRLVIVDNCDFDKDNLKKYEDLLDKIRSNFENFNPSTFVFFIYRSDKLFEGKFLKSIQKFGSVYELGRLDSKSFLGFISKFFLRNGVKLEPKAANYLSQRLRYLDRDSVKTLYEVENELKKLLNNIKSKTPTIADIEESVIDTFEEKIFGLLDFMCSKDLRKSLLAYSTMKDLDEYMILNMMIRQIRNMICVKDCLSKKISSQNTQSYCGIGNFELGKLSKFTHRYQMSSLLEIHNLCFEMDKKLKTSRRKISDIIERVILEFCSK